MLSIDPRVKQALIEQFTSKSHERALDSFHGRREVVSGRTTKLTCRCGGALETIYFKPRLPEPPTNLSRKKRIRKKQMKRWLQEHRAEILLEGIASAMLNERSPFRCTVCGRREGMYSVVGRNLFIVEKLPDGAAPIYMKDPGITE